MNENNKNNKDNEENKFIAECMERLKDEYSDIDQRFAVCYSKYKQSKDLNKQDNTETNEKKEIIIFPRGRFYLEKYQKYFDFNNDFFNQIINTFKNSNLPKPFIDIDHEKGKSYGEIVDLFITDKGLKGIIELNDEGKELLKNKSYKYISPSFGEIIDTKGQRWYIYLDSVSLTNTPALLNELPELQKQFNLNHKGGFMKKNEKFELSQITDEATKKFVESLIEQGEKLEEIIASLETQVAELKKKLEETIKEKQKIEDEVKQKEVEEFINKQLNDKKIDISVVDFWKEQYLLNKEKVIKYFDTLKNKTINDNASINLNYKYSLTEYDVAVIKSLGWELNEENIKLYFKANKKEDFYD